MRRDVHIAAANFQEKEESSKKFGGHAASAGNCGYHRLSVSSSSRSQRIGVGASDKPIKVNAPANYAGSRRLVSKRRKESALVRHLPL